MENTIIIIGSGKDLFTKKRSIINQVHLSDEYYSVIFIPIEGTDYYSGLDILRKKIPKIKCCYLIVVRNYRAKPDFVDRIKSTLNKRFKDLRAALSDTRTIHIDLRRQTKQDLYPGHKKDLPSLYRYHGSMTA